MFPIPTPDRLIPRFQNPSARTSGPQDERSLLAKAGEGLFFLGIVGLFVAAAMICGYLASIISVWLAIPGGIFGLWVTAKIVRNLRPLTVVLEALLYGVLVASMQITGADPTEFSIHWVAGALVGALFLWAGFSTLKRLPRAR
jgi:hypothetical protein